MVDGIEVGYATRRDECFGFGGTFTIWDSSCSGQQGLDKVNDYAKMENWAADIGPDSVKLCLDFIRIEVMTH